MSETSERIAELREKFFEKLREEGPPSGRDFHPADINRVKTDDWLKRFLDHHENNVTEALKMLWDTCEWRRDFGTNDITENNVRRDYLEDGVCFGYGKDIDGKKLFVIKSKLHTKGSRDFNELQRCIVYWFERLEREGNGDQISLFFDMIDSGISNMDMELTKYLIGLFKNYYPNFLNYIIILEMPWVLNAAFNIIKTWLPAKAIPKIKNVKRNTLDNFVDPNDALKCWGGNNDFAFIFLPERQIGMSNGKGDKNVHFNSSTPDSPNSDFGDQSKREKLLTVEPDILIFKKIGSEITGTITLKNNTADKSVSYKIKTTSPEKFKVRPCTGTLPYSETTAVTITMQPGYETRNLLPNDKFLIMCLPIKNSQKFTNQELVEFWKSYGSQAEQHRLMCKDANGSSDGLKSILVNSGAYGGDQSLNSLFSKISRLEEHNTKIENNLNSVKHFLFVSVTIILLLLGCIVYLLTNNSEFNFKNLRLKNVTDSVLSYKEEF
ncbi:hypothetical protein TKK_0007181 [Trichogramma kaykai]|uniref:Motile sperm domain-containing protein 2 n=1 Tax=Trichogramma kaykai TaxID=54128 RepID=A0ABD2X990_9HYME